MKFSPYSVATLFTFLVFVWSCSPNENTNPTEDQTCFRCEYAANIQNSCDSILSFEACIIRPHESSLQDILGISEKCNGQIIDTSEEIGFMEDFLATHQNAGANCKEF